MTRLSNYELIRVLSMILIVFHHFSTHLVWIFDTDDTSFKRQCAELLGTGGKVGVDLFVMLTGYFLAGRSAKVASVVRIWVQVVEYSLSFYVIFFFHRKMGTDDLLASLFPIVRGNYWFVPSYIIVVSLSPAISKVVTNLSHNEFIGTLVIMFTTMSIVPYFSFSSPSYSTVFWLLFVYLLGSYFKLYEGYYERYRTRTYFIGMIITLAINAATISFFTTHIKSEWVTKYGGIQMLTIDTPAPLAAFMGVFIFLFLGRLEFSSQMVNTLAGSTFGVYLIHENIYLGDLLWNDWLAVQDHYYESGFYIFMIVAPLAVYLVCSVIDILRQRLFNQYEQWLVNRLANLIISTGNYISRSFISQEEIQVVENKSKI